ncbi:S1C family serine protease [Butyrivibrio sp. YAB3001]|uniref:S1C family serine protease n=1 Tax=Butyrivibrio sp. YAB3001 TaxID=1520812 RepID=UPI0008F6632F|nr:S1C family serine protease [Butyrivibrio sp. YAB3001]SFC10537.1 serine protease Do [Butyrivibrio sp. YAB3001]
MPFNQDENKKDKLANTTFISEKIKQRPINRKKLLRRTIITISLAVIFGIVACFTFLLLQPVFSDKLYPEKEPDVISFPEESASDELTPEEMVAVENEIAASEAQSLEANQKDQIDQAIASYTFNSTDYGKMMASLKVLATDANRSIVKVTAISSDSNWFNSSYQSSGSTSGLIVADNGNNYYILAPYEKLKDAESIGITFCNSITVEAQLKLVDTITNLCVLSVKKAALSLDTRNSIIAATLGSSNTSSITGLPVIAVGSPIGIQGSISYGIITSEKTTIDLPDSTYKLLTSDIQGSSEGSGVLINLYGQVVGIIDMTKVPSDLSGNICAIGITELKTLIENLSNGKNRAYLGIHGTTVPEEIQTKQNVPAGAYITLTETGSPAMKAGIQSGDIITFIDDTEITSYELLINKLASLSPDDVISITVMRQAPTDYVEMKLEATLSGATHD